MCSSPARSRLSYRHFLRVQELPEILKVKPDQPSNMKVRHLPLRYEPSEALWLNAQQRRGCVVVNQVDPRGRLECLFVVHERTVSPRRTRCRIRREAEIPSVGPSFRRFSCLLLPDFLMASAAIRATALSRAGRSLPTAAFGTNGRTCSKTLRTKNNGYPL